MATEASDKEFSRDQKDAKDAAENALQREKSVAPGEAPVKQHNPGNQGINPGQKGPAQPSGDNEAGSVAGS